LTELGQAQAKAVAARIAKTWNPAKVYTSPMGRCVARRICAWRWFRCND
jgi:broad specificity phosphatase PhoE